MLFRRDSEIAVTGVVFRRAFSARFGNRGYGTRFAIFRRDSEIAVTGPVILRELLLAGGDELSRMTGDGKARSVTSNQEALINKQ